MSCNDASAVERPRLFQNTIASIEGETETTVLEAGGSFTSADLWFIVPGAWSEATVIVRLYARLGSTRALLTTLALGDAGGLTSFGQLSGLAASSRGRPCDGYVVTVEHDSVTPLESGEFIINAWSGPESPEVLGGAPFGENVVRGPVRAEPSVAVVAGQVADAGTPGERFHVLKVDADGRVSVIGSDVPAEARDNPTTNIPVTAFHQMWDPNTEKWHRPSLIDLNNELIPQWPTPFYVQATYSFAGGYAHEIDQASFFVQRVPTDDTVQPPEWAGSLDCMGRNMVWQPDGGEEGVWRRMQGDGNGNVRTIGGLPPATGGTDCRRTFPKASASSAGAAIHNAAMKLLGVRVSLVGDNGTWFQLFDSSSGPDSAPFYSELIPIEGAYSFQLGAEHWGEGGKELVEGLSFGISSTPTTYTAATAIAVSVNVTCST